MLIPSLAAKFDPCIALHNILHIVMSARPYLESAQHWRRRQQHLAPRDPVAELLTLASRTPNADIRCQAVLAPQLNITVNK
jgi:hypothetical protein